MIIQAGNTLSFDKLLSMHRPLGSQQRISVAQLPDADNAMSTTRVQIFASRTLHDIHKSARQFAEQITKNFAE